eukprot:15290187-Ditylum_brightwellii.AAC.1
MRFCSDSASCSAPSDSPCAVLGPLLGGGAFFFLAAREGSAGSPLLAPEVAACAGEDEEGSATGSK